MIQWCEQGYAAAVASLSRSLAGTTFAPEPGLGLARSSGPNESGSSWFITRSVVMSKVCGSNGRGAAGRHSELTSPMVVATKVSSVLPCSASAAAIVRVLPSTYEAGTKRTGICHGSGISHPEDAFISTLFPFVSPARR